MNEIENPFIIVSKTTPRLMVWRNYYKTNYWYAVFPCARIRKSSYPVTQTKSVFVIDRHLIEKCTSKQLALILEIADELPDSTIVDNPVVYFSLLCFVSLTYLLTRDASQFQNFRVIIDCIYALVIAFIVVCCMVIEGNRKHILFDLFVKLAAKSSLEDVSEVLRVAMGCDTFRGTTIINQFLCQVNHTSRFDKSLTRRFP